MKIVVLVILWIKSFSCLDEVNNKRFPADFLFGVATSAYQVEGGYREDGKTESLWDYATHTNSNFVKDHGNADITCDSYHKYQEDVAFLKELGVTSYRFSIAWTRILPTGYADFINKKGVQYYKNLIRELKHNGIQPFVTIFHWDIPQVLQTMGGVLNESFVDWLGNYARVAFKLFGDDVKYWITINEPFQYCIGSYGYGYFPPGVKSEALLEYQCFYNLLKAHARVWRIYDKEFRFRQKGKVSISLDIDAYLPATNSILDQEATERKLQFTLGMFAHPIFLGDYPDVVKFRIAERSRAEGRQQSRLPTLTHEEREYIKGTHDFMGLNIYTAYTVSDLGYDLPITKTPGTKQDETLEIKQPPDWETSAAWSIIKVVPWSVRPLLKWIQKNYNNPEIIITENGFPTVGGLLDDDRRIYYMKGYLSSIRDAMVQDEVRILGYIYWSLIDNFEWGFGYNLKFGLLEVDFNSPNRTRTPRPSAYFYKNVIKTKCLATKCVD